MKVWRALSFSSLWGGVEEWGVKTMWREKERQKFAQSEKRQ